MSTTTTHPAWCDGAHVDGDCTGIGYSVTIRGQRGEVIPSMVGVDSSPTVVLDIPWIADLTPAEARRLARALEIIAATVEDAADGERP